MPLTLLLSPLDELARRRAELPADLGQETDMAARNARSLPGSGTAFTVWIPVAPPGRPPPVPVADDPVRSGPHRRAPAASALAMVASSWNRGEPGEAPEAGIPDAIAGENPGADPPAGGGDM
jgi:hypothetical protein